jgi:DNA repair protein RecN (Recombination protein N)
MAEVLAGALAQAEDAAHSLSAYARHAELDPESLAELDERLAAWVTMSRRYRRPPAELPALLAGWKAELAALDAAADLDALERAEAVAEQAWRSEAQRISALRRRAAPGLSQAVTQAMQPLGMAGGRFEVAVEPAAEPQAHGLDLVEFRVAGHAGSTPRALAKVASGGELSRLALAIAVTTAPGAAGDDSAAMATLIFDEIDSGVGGTVGDAVGRLMKQLGTRAQVLAVTHLAQVAACADRHFVVAKQLRGGSTLSDIHAVDGESRVAEIARMLGGEKLSGMAHAQTLLQGPRGARAASR